jgi:hypothetical protein
MAYSYSRTRSRSDPSQEQTVDRQFWGTMGSYSESLGPYLTYADAQTMEDVVTPGYQKLISDGAVINNACTLSRTSIETRGSGYGSHQNVDGDGGWEWSGPHTARQLALGHYPSDQIEEPSVQLPNGAAARCISNIDSTPYEFGEDVLELRETLRFLKNPVKGISRLSSAFARDLKSLKQIKSRAKAIAQLWLEYRFAFSPLVRSAHDAVEAYLSTIPRGPERRSARAFDYDTASSAGSPSVVVGGSTLTFRGKKTLSRTERRSILYHVSNPVYDWRHKLGLRNKDLPATIWQVFPYSFMVDRMFNLTHLVKGVTKLTDPSVTVLAGSVTYLEESEHEVQLLSIVNPTLPGSTSGEIHTTRNFSYVRSPWTPQYRDTVPPVNVGGLVNSAENIADLASLILRNLR